jgi:deoxyhypusine monooxygenase
MAVTKYSTSPERNKLFEEMEARFDDKNVDYFKKLLTHKDSVVRTRAVCILAEIAGEAAVAPIGKVLKDDDNDLVRHEAAFSLGQLGFTSGIKPLADAVKNDSSLFVRHEAAVALGVIGSEDARKTLDSALADESEEVRDSAVVALANLDYIKAVNRRNDFTRMTGG